MQRYLGIYRLEKEVEIKEMIPESQAGFSKGRSTIDNIFILNL